MRRILSEDIVHNQLNTIDIPGEGNSFAINASRWAPIKTKQKTKYTRISSTDNPTALDHLHNIAIGFLKDLAKNVATDHFDTTTQRMSPLKTYSLFNSFQDTIETFWSSRRRLPKSVETAYTKPQDFQRFPSDKRPSVIEWS